MSSFLEVKNLCVNFPTEDGLVKAVDNLSFSVEKGKTLGIVGESEKIQIVGGEGTHSSRVKKRTARSATACSFANVAIEYIVYSTYFVLRLQTQSYEKVQSSPIPQTV